MTSAINEMPNVSNHSPDSPELYNDGKENLEVEMIDKPEKDLALATKPLSNEKSEAPEDYALSWRTWAAVIVLSFGNAAATFVNIVATTLRYQLMSVGGIPLAAWVPNSNFLVAIAVGPACGLLSDRYIACKYRA